MSEAQKFRKTAAWGRARNIVLAEEDTCGTMVGGFFIGCGLPVDKTLPRFQPGSPEVDHIIPLEMGGHPTDRKNLTLMHKRCNGIKGDRMPSAEMAEKFKKVAEERWVGTDLDWSDIF